MGKVRAEGGMFLGTGALLAGYTLGRIFDIISWGGAMLGSTATVVSVAAGPKKVTSDNFRFVFIAGIEGAGHHYVMASDNDMFQSNPENISRISKDYELSSRPYFLPHAMGGNASSYIEAEHHAVQEMQELAKEVASLPFPGTVYVTHDAWSYPTFTGAQKVMQYIDVQMMAKVAEAAGIDMRVLYLRRAAKEIVVANAVHRDFQTALGKPAGAFSPEESLVEYMRILFTDIGVMHSLLLELPPGHVVCHDWDMLGDEMQASRIAKFVAPNDFVAGLFASALVETVSAHGSATDKTIEPLPYNGTDAMVSRLQRKFDAFETLLCGPHSRPE